MPVQCDLCSWRGPRTEAGEAGDVSCPDCGAGRLEWVPARPGVPGRRTIQPA